MIRHLAPLPATYNIARLRAATVTRFPKAKGVNEVDTSLAVYFEDADAPTAAAVTAWRADIAAATDASPVAEETILAQLAALLASAPGELTTRISAGVPKPATAAAQASMAFDNVQYVMRVVRALVLAQQGRLDTTP
jgi:hypothetical protein